MTTDRSTLNKIANDVVDHCRKWPTISDDVIWKKHWHPDCVSVEGDGKVYNGLGAMTQKMRAHGNEYVMRGVKVEGPFIGESSFTMICEADMEPKNGSHPRMWMKEICVYTVKDGKIVREEFQFPPMAF